MAKDTDKEVTLIYIPGILAVDSDETEKDIRSLHKHFANKKLGEYTISPEYKMILWGGIPRSCQTYKLFQDGLVGINTEHNNSKCKETYEAKLSLLLSPICRFLLIQDSGSSAHAVFWRNYLHNHLYDVIWYLMNDTNGNQIFDLIQDEINETDGNFVIFGNSFGAIVALDFVLNRIALSEDISNQENFVGLITTADASNTVFSPVWSSRFLPEEYELKSKKFIDYIVKNKKFWISYNHRSDIISSGLAPKLTANNGEGEGFIIGKINKTRPLFNYIRALKFWDKTDGLLQSHNWCFHRPKEFSTKVLDAYNENYGYKSTTSKAVKDD